MREVGVEKGCLDERERERERERVVGRGLFQVSSYLFALLVVMSLIYVLFRLLVFL